MNATKIENLRNKIFEVFPKKNSPPISQVVSDEYGDSLLVSTKLDGSPWWELSEYVVESIHDKIALLSPTGFHYYLPAFLLAALQPFEPSNRVLEFTLYNLSPTKTNVSDLRWTSRFNFFSRDQINLIRDFLSLVLEDQKMYSFYKDAERGLSKFWVSS